MHRERVLVYYFKACTSINSLNVGLFNDKWSQKGHFAPCMMVLYSMFADHQMKHRVVEEIGSQRGDCTWSFQCSSGVCVDMNGLHIHATIHNGCIYQQILL